MSHHRVAVLSDIHGNYHAFTAVLADIEQQEIGKIIVSGDSTGLSLQNRVFDSLFENKAAMIRGNGEQRIVRKNRGQIPRNIWNQKNYAGNRWVYNDLEASYKNFLEFLPDQRVVKYEGTSPIRVVHGSPHDTSGAQGVLPEQTSIDSQKLIRVHRTIGIEDAVIGVNEALLICGHTHRPWIQRIEDILVVNPGSVGNPCNGDPSADYAVLTWSNDQWSVDLKAVPYNLKLVYNAFRDEKIQGITGAFGRSTLLCRMTGLDVTLDYLLYVKELQREENLSYDIAYSDASESFDWEPYEMIIQKEFS